MVKPVDDGFPCLPYEKMNSMQKMLHDENVSGLMGLQLKMLQDGRIKNRVEEPRQPTPRKSFADWATTH